MHSNLARHMKDDTRNRFRDAREDRTTAHEVPHTPQTDSASYALAFADDDFLCRKELRPVRLQLELLKTEMLLDEEGVDSTIVLFGGARIPNPDSAATGRGALHDLSHYYEEARKFSRLMTEQSLQSGQPGDNIIVTGGGPGVMEAGNRGAAEAGGRSIGLSIVLPHEQAPNTYVTPGLSFNFHYFAIRKMHFLMRARAVCVFPGGFGTMDEMFEALTLIQTGRMQRIPFLLFGQAFWERIINWSALVDSGTISEQDLTLFRFVETAEQAIQAIENWGPITKRQDIPGRE